MEKPKLLEVVTKVVEALEPFSSDERKRIIKASLTVLEEDYSTPVGAAPIAQPHPLPISTTEKSVGELTDVHLAAQRWMKNYNISRDELDQVFHIESGNVSVLSVELPAKNKKANTHSAYILTGIAALIGTGEPTVDDKAARALCENLGCYDLNNHSASMRDVGNILNGSKGSGYKLTAPGLKEAAALVKKITSDGAAQ